MFLIASAYFLDQISFVILLCGQEISHQLWGGLSVILRGLRVMVLSWWASFRNSFVPKLKRLADILCNWYDGGKKILKNPLSSIFHMSPTLIGRKTKVDFLPSISVSMKVFHSSALCFNLHSNMTTDCYFLYQESGSNESPVQLEPSIGKWDCWGAISRSMALHLRF